MSERIRVRSIVGRFLEHSRVFWANNGGAPEVYIGSADLMPRNLDRRVEVLAPIRDPKLVARLRSEVLEAYLRDTVKARTMNADGSYARVRPADGLAPLDAQESLLATPSPVTRKRKRKGTPQKKKLGRSKGRS